MMLFQTERLLIRQFTAEDGGDFFLMNGDEAVMRYIRPVKTREESDAFLREQLQFYREFPLLGRWAVYQKASGAFVGSVGLVPVQNSEDIQLGYALLPPYWGRGYATELARAAIRFYFQYASRQVLLGFVLPENTRSILVLHKCGFQPAGRVQEDKEEVLRFTLTLTDYERECGWASATTSSQTGT